MSISQSTLSGSSWSGVQIDGSNNQYNAQVYFSIDASIQVILTNKTETISYGPYPTIINNKAIQIISPYEREEDAIWFVSKYNDEYMELTYMPKSPFEKRLKLKKII